MTQQDALAALSRMAAERPEALLAVALLALLVVLSLVGLRRTRASAEAAEPLIRQVHVLASRVETLGHGQHQLAGGLTQVAEAQTRAQAQTLAQMERRLAEMAAQMGESLSGSAVHTSRALGALQERLETIDRAQGKIERLSGDVLSLQDILSNKQARGAFGEIQLRDILSMALPADLWTWQATLSNGRRVDALIRLPGPPGPLGIDAKFPLEAYQALCAAKTERETTEAQRLFRNAIRHHIRSIAERYILEGETADGALMFLPSEAVYARLHADFGDLVREGFAARVWAVSPTTCMAVLHTMRGALKDSRIRSEAAAIRRTLGLLHRDMALVSDRVAKLRSHFEQARSDLDGIMTAAERAGRRAERLDQLDFAEDAPYRTGKAEESDA